MQPPAFDMRTYQRKIDQIVGRNRDGKSIAKLVWMPEVWTFVVGERVKRYWVKRIKDGENWLYVSPPRFGLERRVERSAYYEAHQATRYQFDQRTGSMTDLGPPPDEYYVFDGEGLIAEHDQFHGASGEPKCCDDAWEGEVKYDLNHRYELTEKRVNAHRRCWGYYREPNESDLQRLAKGIKSRDEGKYFDPYKPLSVEELAVIEIEANMQAQRVEEEADAQLKQASSEFNAVYGWRLNCDDPTKLRHGRQHFMGFNTVTGETLKQTAWQRTTGGVYVSP